MHADAALDLAPTTLPADRNPAIVYIARLAAGSRPTQRTALATMAGILGGGRLPAEAFPWQSIRYQHAAAIRSALAARYAPATANRMLAALRGVLRECWRLGLISADDYQHAIDLEAVRGSRVMPGRALTPGELQALFRDCGDGSPAGARDAALLAVLYGCGLRRSEAVELDLEDVDLDAGRIRVVGKGNKQREIPLVNGSLDALAAWCEFRGDAPGPLLVPVLKSGRIVPRRMTAQAVLFALRRRAAGADVAPFTPHDCRRTFVGDTLDSGADITTVAALAGHASPTTTARYDRRGDEVRRRAVAGLHVPFVRSAGPSR